MLHFDIFVGLRQYFSTENNSNSLCGTWSSAWFSAGPGTVPFIHIGHTAYRSHSRVFHGVAMLTTPSCNSLSSLEKQHLRRVVLSVVSTRLTIGSPEIGSG